MSDLVMHTMGISMRYFRAIDPRHKFGSFLCGHRLACSRLSTCDHHT